MVLLLLEVLESASKTSAIRKTFTLSSFLESVGVKTGLLVYFRLYATTFLVVNYRCLRGIKWRYGVASGF